MSYIDEKGRRHTTATEQLTIVNGKYGFCKLHGETCKRVPRECWPEEVQQMIPEKPIQLTEKEMARAKQEVERWIEQQSNPDVK